MYSNPDREEVPFPRSPPRGSGRPRGCRSAATLPGVSGTCSLWKSCTFGLSLSSSMSPLSASSVSIRKVSSCLTDRTGSSRQSNAYFRDFTPADLLHSRYPPLLAALAIPFGDHHRTWLAGTLRRDVSGIKKRMDRCGPPLFHRAAPMGGGIAAGRGRPSLCRRNDGRSSRNTRAMPHGVTVHRLHCSRSRTARPASGAGNAILGSNDHDETRKR